ncbi:MAG: cytochrome c-type biogenesis protein CcmH [Anaerolineales bacterium]
MSKKWTSARLIQLALISMALLILAVPLGTASAQDGGPTDNEVNDIAEQLYCPVCENIPLDVCGTEACVQWRSLIREKLAEGWTEQEIKNYFVEQYGDRVLATPPARGLNWLVYILPPVALLAGAGVLFRAVRSWQRSGDDFEVEDVPESTEDPYIAQLEQELAARQGLEPGDKPALQDEAEDE